MAHKIPEANITYKKGDRVQGLHSGRFGTVSRSLSGDAVQLEWDGHPGEVHDVWSRDLRPAPWHGIGFAPISFIDLRAVLADYGKLDDDVEITDAGTVGGAEKAFMYKKGDRVKLKYNRNNGTIAEDQRHLDNRTIRVIWDKDRNVAAVEEIADLYTLHAPRDTDAVNPNQEAIDAIEKQRAVLKKEIEDLQSRLGTLSQAKRLLERG